MRIFLHEKGIADRFEEQIYDMSPVGEQRQRWQRRPTFLVAYADRSSGVPELDHHP